jgi:hypothetical protein
MTDAVRKPDFFALCSALCVPSCTASSGAIAPAASAISSPLSASSAANLSSSGPACLSFGKPPMVPPAARRKSSTAALSFAAGMPRGTATISSVTPAAAAGWTSVLSTSTARGRD